MRPRGREGHLPEEEEGGEGFRRVELRKEPRDAEEEEAAGRRGSGVEQAAMWSGVHMGGHGVTC